MDTLKSFSLLTVILLILFYKIKFTLKTERKKKTVQWVIYPLYMLQFQNNLLNAMFSYFKIKIIIL